MLQSSNSVSSFVNVSGIESYSLYNSLSTSVSWVSLLGMLVILGSLNNSGIHFISQVALLFIVLVLVQVNSAFVLFAFLAKRIHEYLRLPLVMCALNCGVYLVAQLLQGSLGGLKSSVGQLIVLLGFYLHCATLRWTNIMLVVLSWMFGLYCALLIALWFLAGLPSRYSGYMTNPNLIGSYAGFSLYFIIIGLLSKQPLIYKLFLGAVCLAGTIFVYFTGCRAILLGLISALVTYALWNKLVTSRKRFQLYYIFVVVVIAVIILLYINIQLMPFANELDAMSKELIGKSIYSERLMIWLAILQKLSLKPILGYGPYYIPKNLMDTSYSAHNVYLQIALQSGLVGLIALIALLGSIWRTLWPGRNDARVRLAGAFLIAIIVHQTFDVSLTQHNPSQALVMWLILGMGTGISLNSAHQTSMTTSAVGGACPGSGTGQAQKDDLSGDATTPAYAGSGTCG